MDRRIDVLIANVEKVFVGKPEAVRNIITALLAGGHVLIEDVPGVGKTTLAQALAQSIDGEFRRIQFTPDLLPSDILGVSIFSQKEDEFRFRKGPIFCNIVVADEINRTTPRTQSSLLEAMNDFQISVDGVTYELPGPFMVIATQNPYEFEGTYPLPENQLDRFLMCTRIGYPSESDEKRVLSDQKIEHPIKSLTAVMEMTDITDLQKMVREVQVADSVTDYLMRIITATRNSEFLEFGASPRGSLSLYRAAQAHALVEERDYVIPEDIAALAPQVLAHRVRLAGPTRRRSSHDAEKVICDMLDTVSAPL